MSRNYLWVLLALVAVNGALMLAGAGRGGRTQCDGRPCIGLVFDVGGLGDKSFNDAAYRGLKRAEDELGASGNYVEPGDGSDRESALRQLASQGHDLIIGVGFIFTNDMLKLAAEFPETKFACIDFSVSPDQPPPPKNLAGLRFREHEGSFLVGAIAGLSTAAAKVGFIGGMDIPLIHKFEAGYTAGVRYVCPKCEVLSAYAGTEPKAFADPTTGKELSLTQFRQGVDIIFHASGKTGSGVFNAAREVGKKAIGVDSDQFYEAPCCVMTSMVKNVDNVVFDTIKDVADGTFTGGVREYGLEQNGVGFIYDDNNRELLAADVVDRVREIAAKIIRGEIEVPSK